MSIEEVAFYSSSDHIPEISDGLSSSFKPIFDDLYNSYGFEDGSWWDRCPNLDQELMINCPTSFNSDANSGITSCDDVVGFDHRYPSSHSSKKWKTHDESSPKTTEIYRKDYTDGGKAKGKGRVSTRKPAGKEKPTAKQLGTRRNNGNDRQERWAEQLLIPCAAAVTTGNFSRVRHFLCVLHELASSLGDANHRLADYGLQALKSYLFPSTNSAVVSPHVINFASVEPKSFIDSFLYFDEINPWFKISNDIANSSILQILQEHDRSCNLHIVDIGVSHGIQWPTLLEGLKSQPGGPPPLVRLTVVNQTIVNGRSGDTPFVSCPPGYGFSSQLLASAKRMKINLKIIVLDNFPLQHLNSEAINVSPDETLIMCTQFRLHNLNHSFPDDRTQFLSTLKGMDPNVVVLSENNADCSCKNCSDYAMAFSRRVDYLWQFLDSTSVGYKWRNTDARSMMEGEAAKVLTNPDEMNERKEKWCERMRSVGFTGAVFGERVIDGARALLKNYDRNWEMRAEEGLGCLDLSWKGQPVSFCSIWK